MRALRFGRDVQVGGQGGPKVGGAGPLAGGGKVAGGPGDSGALVSDLGTPALCPRPSRGVAPSLPPAHRRAGHPTARVESGRVLELEHKDGGSEGGPRPDRRGPRTSKGRGAGAS